MLKASVDAYGIYKKWGITIVFGVIMQEKQYAMAVVEKSFLRMLIPIYLIVRKLEGEEINKNLRR